MFTRKHYEKVASIFKEAFEDSKENIKTRDVLLDIKEAFEEMFLRDNENFDNDVFNDEIFPDVEEELEKAGGVENLGPKNMGDEDVKEAEEQQEAEEDDDEEESEEKEEDREDGGK